MIQSLVLILALLGPPALGALDLPVDATALSPEARSAWLDVLKVAPAAEHWMEKWNRTEPREQVVATLSRSLKLLTGEAEKPTASLDVLLAAGITGRLAHNLDIPGAAEACLKQLAHAAVIAPDDPRPPWQLGVSHCEMGESELAIPQLTRAEGLWSKAKPPAAYWHTALQCFQLANMPAHVLRAAAQLRRVGELSAQDQTSVRQAKELLVTPDPSTKLEPAEAFSIRKAGAGRALVSAPCGYAVPLKPDQPIQASPLQNATCVAQLGLGPFPGKAGEVFPSVLVLARVARKGETLQAFLDGLSIMKERKAVAPIACPAAGCQGFEVDMPTAYLSEGRGIVTAVTMERPQPEFPSVLIEGPSSPPTSDGGQMRYFVLQPRPTRFEGRIFYLFVLDTARSVLTPARGDFKKLVSESLVE